MQKIKWRRRLADKLRSTPPLSENKPPTDPSGRLRIICFLNGGVGRLLFLLLLLLLLEILEEDSVGVSGSADDNDEYYWRWRWR